MLQANVTQNEVIYFKARSIYPKINMDRGCLIMLETSKTRFRGHTSAYRLMCHGLWLRRLHERKHPTASTTRVPVLSVLRSV